MAIRKRTAWIFATIIVLVTSGTVYALTRNPATPNITPAMGIDINSPSPNQGKILFLRKT